MSPPDDKTPSAASQDQLIRQLRLRQQELERQNQILQDQNQKLGTLFDSIADPILYADMGSMQFIHVNAAACVLLGYSEAEMLALQLKHITSPHLHTRFNEIKLQLNDVGLCVYESEFVRKNRSRIAVEMHAKKIQINGQPILVASARDITARKQLEASLFETSNLFRFVLDSLPQLIWLKDKKSRYIFGNTAYIKRLGITVTDIISKTDDDFFPPDLAKKYQDDDFMIVASRQMKIFDERSLYAGKDHFVRTTKVPLFNADKEVYATLGIAEDITDLKTAELQIRKLVQAVEQSPECIVITNLNAEIEFVNESFLHTTGYRREELIGQNSRILQSGKTPPKNYKQLWNALTNGRQWQGELYNRRKDGKEYIEFARISPIRQEDGRISHYLAIKEDITEKKRNNTLILESKMLLQRVIDSIPDWVFVFDRINRYMLVNESYATFFNLRTDLMVGMTDEEIHQVVINDDSPYRFGLNSTDHIRTVFNGQSLHHRSETVSTSDDQSYVFETYWIPLFDAANTVYGALCYRRNITARIRAELQQSQLAEQLHQAQKMEMVGQFTGGIAHDFNNILASIFGYAELLKEAPAVAENPKLARYVDQILLVGTRARDLVRNLMVFSQKDEAPQQAISVSGSVEEVVESLRPSLPAQFDIKLYLDRNLPNVSISPVQLHQVIMNLVVNARDSMAGNGVLTISVALAEMDSTSLCNSCHANFSGHFVRLAVQDTGSGIYPAVLKRIFDPFFTTKKMAGGSGLGLSVLHGIIHSAGGHVCVSSKPGQGTEFGVFFPATSSVSVPALAPPEVVRHQRDRHIMLVDDEPGIVSYLKDLLEASGYRVSCFTEASVALCQFQANPADVDLLITDQEMEELNGVDLVRAMHILRPDLPVVMCTGYSRDIDEKVANGLGVAHFLVKPIPGNVMLQAISSCLSTGRA